MEGMTAGDLVVAPGQAEQTASDMRMVVRSARLDGCFSVMEGEVRPGEILAFHTHANEDQHMYLLNGELHFEVGGADGIRFTAAGGSHVLKPRGSSHGFWNLGDEPVRYIETSTRDGFERFVDGRREGLGTMVDDGTDELGMSFELHRTVEVMREFKLTGLAGANASNPAELLADPAVRRLIREDRDVRELLLRVGGGKLRTAIRQLLPGAR